MVSTGHGKCTCGYFFPGDRRMLFSSTHWADPAAPPRPDYSKGYIWQMFKSYAIFTARPDGSNLKQLTHFGNYTAESTINKRGEIVFTRIANGDLDIYKMDRNGKNVKRLTREPGYDGGPWWTPDGKRIVYRRSAFKNKEELRAYRRNLKKNLYSPTALEIWIMNADGSHKRQITHLGAASFAPYMHPDGKHILFASNFPDVRSREFDLFMIRDDGTGLERITYTKAFDGFPMFSPDGKKLAFSSNRHGKQREDTNVFIADWVW
jgi:Tol biopolymer transport system component